MGHSNHGHLTDNNIDLFVEGALGPSRARPPARPGYRGRRVGALNTMEVSFALVLACSIGLAVGSWSTWNYAGAKEAAALHKQMVQERDAWISRESEVLNIVENIVADNERIVHDFITAGQPIDAVVALHSLAAIASDETLSDIDAARRMRDVARKTIQEAISLGVMPPAKEGD